MSPDQASSEQGANPNDGRLGSPGASTTALAHQRAPTLLASDTAGAGGEVRVWSPRSSLDRAAKLQMLRIEATFLVPVGVAAAIVAMAVNGLIHPVLGLVLVAAVALPLFLLRRVILGWFRDAASASMGAHMPSFVATDAAGISFQIGGHATARPWDSVLGLYTTQWPVWYLFTTDGPHVITTTGLSHADSQSLADRICLRAGLQRLDLPETELRAFLTDFVRSSQKLRPPPTGAQSALPGPKLNAAPREISAGAVLYLRPGLTRGELLEPPTRQLSQPESGADASPHSSTTEA